MHINGKVFTRNDLKKMAAYVMQDDLMNAYMTGAHIAFDALSDIRPAIHRVYLHAPVTTRRFVTVKSASLSHTTSPFFLRS